MASKSKSVTGMNVALLTTIMQATDAGGFHYVTKDEAAPFIAHNPQLIMVNQEAIDPSDANKRAAKISDAGRAFLANEATGGAAKADEPAASPFAIIKGVVLPEDKKRGGFGGGGAPTIYPFDDLGVGDTFFVPATEKKPNPAKSLASTISAQHIKYAVKTGEEQKERTKRGEKNRAVKDADGNPVKETVTVPVYKHTRKFKVKPVEAGKKYGDWVAPSNGAVVSRVQ